MDAILIKLWGQRFFRSKIKYFTQKTSVQPLKIGEEGLATQRKR
jgi:hypothetical protein